MFKTTALYVKTHNVTGFKYFGKTTRLNQIHTYKGSGVHWVRHLKKHGNDYKTELLGIWQNRDRLIKFAKDFCEKNNVVSSKEWANMVPEEGLQGALNGEANISKRKDVRQKMSINSAKNCLGKFGENHPSFKGWYITPLGRFPSLSSAGKAHNRSVQTIHQNIYGHKQTHGNWSKNYPPKEGWGFESKEK